MPRLQYPYIHAWGVNLGSFPYYMEAESEEATSDNAPPDVIYRKDFDRISEAERDMALAAERDGTAVIIRRGGEPVRVWYRVNAIVGNDTRTRITTMAERLIAGKPARG